MTEEEFINKWKWQTSVEFGSAVFDCSEQLRNDLAELWKTKDDEILKLFIKGAKQLKMAVDEKYLFHSMICNFPESHKREDGTFCNCGITDVIYAYRQYEKTSDNS